MEELWRRSQKQKKDKSRQQLNHRLVTNDLLERTTGYRFEQPTANHKEARQSEEVEDAIISHQRGIHAEITDMSIDYENHRKSSHCVNICYTLLCHFICKSKEKSWNSWLFHEKNVTL